MKVRKEMEFTCHWHPEMKCLKELYCAGCEHQPADDDKPNGKEMDGERK